MKKETIFFWIPKNAGSSIYKILKEDGCKKLKYKKEYKNFDNREITTFGHVDIKYLLKKGYLDKNYFENSFKFCFVRNPWDRFVSSYHYRNYNDKMKFEEFVFLIKKKFELRNSLKGGYLNL